MHSCKETLPSSVKIECMSVEAGFYFGKPNWIRTDLKILFYIEIKDYVLCSNNIFENVNFLFFFLFFLLSQYSFSFPQFKETFQSTHKHGDILQQFCLINKHTKFFSYFLVWVALHMATISQIQVLIFLFFRDLCITISY